jgi:hypothetical protein
MGEHGLLALYEHPATAAAAVLDAPVVRFKHFHQQFYNAIRRPKLAAFFPSGIGKLAAKVFIFLWVVLNTYLRQLDII